MSAVGECSDINLEFDHPFIILAHINKTIRMAEQRSNLS
jgi:hypothetical protein